MIDIHCHIIPKIDDGSDSIEESYHMFEEALKAGFTDIIATSHYLEEHYETNASTRRAWIKAIEQVLQEKQIPLQIHIGSEIYITPNLISLIKEKKASTLADSKYVLFELPMNQTVKYLEEIIFEIKANGMIPILAHPERYMFVQKEPMLLYDLIQQGLLLQGNYVSAIQVYGTKAKQTIKKLLKANMLHFLGSDAHRSNRYTLTKQSLEQIEKWIGKDKLDRLTKTNPRHILENKEFQIENPEKIKKSFFGN